MTFTILQVQENSHTTPSTLKLLNHYKLCSEVQHRQARHHHTLNYLSSPAMLGICRWSSKASIPATYRHLFQHLISGGVDVVIGRILARDCCCCSRLDLAAVLCYEIQRHVLESLLSDLHWVT